MISRISFGKCTQLSTDPGCRRLPSAAPASGRRRAPSRRMKALGPSLTPDQERVRHRRQLHGCYSLTSSWVDTSRKQSAQEMSLGQAGLPARVARPPPGVPGLPTCLSSYRMGKTCYSDYVATPLLSGVRSSQHPRCVITGNAELLRGCLETSQSNAFVTHAVLPQHLIEPLDSSSQLSVPGAVGIQPPTRLSLQPQQDLHGHLRHPACGRIRPQLQGVEGRVWGRAWRT